MKRLLLGIVIITISIIFIGCQGNQTDISKGNDANLETSTNVVTVEPTQEPTPTPTKEPTPTPTATPNYNFDVAVELSTESFNIGVLDMDKKYLNSTPINANTELNIMDIDGDIYYFNRKIYKIGEDGNIIDAEIKKLSEILDLSENFFNRRYGICETDNNLYCIYQGIDYGQETEPHYYYLINLDDYSINEKYNWKPEGYFGNKILVRLRYDENYGWIKGVFDVRRNRLTEIDDLEKYVGYYLREVVYATEDYFVIDLRNRSNYDDGKYIIVDMSSYDEIAAIDFDDLSVIQPVMYLAEEGIFYIFDEGNACIKSYNTLTGEVKTEAQFDHNCKFIKYEQEENSIYLQAYDYIHKGSEETYIRHSCVEDCVSSSDWENSKLIYIKYDLSENKITVLNRVELKEYLTDIDGDTCINLVKDLKMGDYIFTYYSDITTETQDSIFFISKFKLGEEIDYDTWKE